MLDFVTATVLTFVATAAPIPDAAAQPATAGVAELSVPAPTVSLDLGLIVDELATGPPEPVPATGGQAWVSSVRAGTSEPERATVIIESLSGRIHLIDTVAVGAARPAE